MTYQIQTLFLQDYDANCRNRCGLEKTSLKIQLNRFSLIELVLKPGSNFDSNRRKISIYNMHKLYLDMSLFITGFFFYKVPTDETMQSMRLSRLRLSLASKNCCFTPLQKVFGISISCPTLTLFSICADTKRTYGVS